MFSSSRFQSLQIAVLLCFAAIGALADDASTWTCPSIFPTTSNLLQNPSFETVDPTDNYGAQFWRAYNQNSEWSGAPDVDITYRAHTGTQAFIFSLFGDNFDSLWYNPSIITTDQTYYLLSFWAYVDASPPAASTPAGSRSIKVIWNNDVLGAADFSNVATSVGGYVQYCLPMLIQGTGSDVLQFMGPDKKGAILFDDVVLQEYDAFVPATTTTTTTIATPTTTTTTASVVTTSTEVDTISPTSTVTATTSTTSTSTTTLTVRPSTTLTLATPTTTSTNIKCNAYYLTFASGCCPTSIMHTSPRAIAGHHRRTVSPFTSTDTTQVSTVLTATPTIVIAETVIDSTTTTTTSTTLSTTATFTAGTITNTVPATQVSTTTSTTTITTTPPTATQTVCQRVNVPEFKCPAGSRSQAILSQLELAFLQLYKAKVPSSAPSLIVQCDGSSSVYTY